MSNGNDIVKSIDRALEIIEILYREHREMRITEIAKELNVYQSTIYRALVTLQYRGYVYQNEENSKYGLGTKLYAIGVSVGNSDAFIQTIKPFVKKLSEEFQETINVCMMDTGMGSNHSCLLIHQETVPGRILGTTEMVGSISESYCSAAGKLLLAYTPDITEEDLKGIDYRKYTPNTITDWKELSLSLEEIKRSRFAVDNEEREEGTFCIGCPVFNKEREIIATISVSGPSSRLHQIGVSSIVERINKAIDEIELLLN